MMTTDRSVTPRRLSRHRPVHGVRPRRSSMVREEDACALVADAALALALRGHAPKITAANGVRLVRLGALMLDAFDVGNETTEVTDGRLDCPDRGPAR